MTEDTEKSGQERRRFSRIHFEAKATIELNNHATQADLHDVSLKGALIELKEEFHGKVHDKVRLIIALSDAVSIEMKCDIVHHHENILGLLCEEIDIESVSHLKRLVELNIGDADLLERDLDALYHSFKRNDV